MKQDMIYVFYVDDIIIAGPDSKKIDELIKDLGVSNQDDVHNSQSKDEVKYEISQKYESRSQGKDSLILLKQD